MLGLLNLLRIGCSMLVTMGVAIVVVAPPIAGTIGDILTAAF
jgi:hypothetical protein